MNSFDEQRVIIDLEEVLGSFYTRLNLLPEIVPLDADIILQWCFSAITIRNHYSFTSLHAKLKHKLSQYGVEESLIEEIHAMCLLICSSVINTVTRMGLWLPNGILPYEFHSFYGNTCIIMRKTDHSEIRD